MKNYREMLYAYGALFLICGCGVTGTQHNAVAEFARASSLVGEMSAAAFPELREDTISMNLYSVSLGGDAQFDNLDEAFDQEDVAVRVAAAETLISYGDLLLALVEEGGQEAPLRAASENLSDRLQSISGDRFDDRQQEQIARLIQTLGGLWVNKERTQALKQVVRDAYGTIEQICDLLIADFDRAGLGLMQGVDVTISRLKSDAMLALDERDRSYADRLVAAQAWRMAEDNDFKLKRISKDARSSLVTLKEANVELMSAIEGNPSAIENIKVKGKQIKEIAESIKEIIG